jgi:hypothetical protein
MLQNNGENDDYEFFISQPLPWGFCGTGETDPPG